MTGEAEKPFDRALEAHARTIEARLRHVLTDRAQMGEVARPERLLAAMRHGVLNGGKRLRPFLVLESSALFDADAEAALVTAAAIECVHCYSLIHDDLPAMDDDDLRRGQPTVHRAFDEATAILAGDALLTLAFDLLADRAMPVVPERRADLIVALARAAGAGGMVGGQMLDLIAETSKPDEAGIITLQAMKTGALIRFSCESGAILAGAGPADRERLAEFGNAIGLAFQLADDLLDVTASTQALGKTAGKDQASGKATLVALHGVGWARRQIDGLVEQAAELLHPFGKKADLLREAARFVAYRRS